MGSAQFAKKRLRLLAVAFEDSTRGLGMLRACSPEAGEHRSSCSGTIRENEKLFRTMRKPITLRVAPTRATGADGVGTWVRSRRIRFRFSWNLQPREPCRWSRLASSMVWSPLSGETVAF